MNGRGVLLVLPVVIAIRGAVIKRLKKKTTERANGEPDDEEDTDKENASSFVPGNFAVHMPQA